MRTFISMWMVQDPSRPIQARLDTYARLFEEHGTLLVVSVERSESTEVTLNMQSKRGPFRLTVKATEAQPMRAVSVTFALRQGGHG